MKNVFAAIVTFSRPQMLSKCLESLIKQKQFGIVRIHVLVNSSDQGTSDVLKRLSAESDIITFEHLDNPGPAGGFHVGLNRFLDSDCDFVWLMDDDVVPAEGCLEELMKHSKDHQYILPKVIKGNGEEVISFGWWGALLSRPLVVKAGLPISDLFFWQEDTEYLQNRIVHVLKTAPYRCKTAEVSHLHLRKKKYPSWYYYYIIRNTLYYRGYIVGYNWRRFKRTVYLYMHTCVMILIKEDNKARKLKLVLYGTYHGLIGRIGKLVDPALNK